MLAAVAFVLGFTIGITAYSLHMKLESLRKKRMKKIQEELWRKKRLARLIEKRRRLRGKKPPSS